MEQTKIKTAMSYVERQLNQAYLKHKDMHMTKNNKIYILFLLLKGFIILEKVELKNSSCIRQSD